MKGIFIKVKVSNNLLCSHLRPRNVKECHDKLSLAGLTLCSRELILLPASLRTFQIQPYFTWIRSSKHQCKNLRVIKNILKGWYLLNFKDKPEWEKEPKIRENVSGRLIQGRKWASVYSTFICLEILEPTFNGWSQSSPYGIWMLKSYCGTSVEINM